jgi:ATP:ADP antiporter, AAA family
MKNKAPQIFLQRLFNIYPNETERVALMFLCSIMTIGGVVIIGQMVSRSLFLGALPESAIPYKFILPPIVLVFVISFYTKMTSLFSRDKLLFTSILIIIAGVIIFRILLESRLKESFIFLMALTIYIEIIVNVIMIQFWMFASDLFTTREAKRLFGLIAGGSTVSSILFGAFLGSISGIIQPKDLMFGMIASLLVCLGSIYYLNKKYNVYSKIQDTSSSKDSPADKAPSNLIQDIKQVFGHKLIIYMSLILICIALVGRIGEYQLDLALKNIYGSDTQKMVAFFGTFQVIAGSVGIIMQFFVASRLIDRFGVLPAMLLLPVAIAGGSTAILLTGGALFAVSIPTASEASLKYSVNEPAMNLLYLPISSELRGKAKAVLEGMVKPAATALLGIIFLFIGKIKGVSLLTWTPLMLILTAGWIVMLVFALRYYVKALGDSIKERRLDIRSENFDPSDEMSKNIIVEALKDKDPMRVLHVLGLIRAITAISWTPYISELLNHPESIIKIEALKYIGEYRSIELAERVKPLLDDHDLLVRKEAILTFCSLMEKDAIMDIKKLLSDEHTDIQSTAIIGLVKYCGLAGLLHASSHLQQLFESSEPRSRMEATKVLESLGVESFYDPLIKFIDDSDINVQLSAIKAAKNICAPELLPYLYKKLDSPMTRQLSSEAIFQCANRHPKVINKIVDETMEFPFIREKLVQLAGKRGTLEDKEFIISLIDDADYNVRSYVYLALINLKMLGYRIDIKKEKLINQLNMEIKNGYELYILKLDVEKNEAQDRILTEAIERRKTGAMNRILTLLVLLYPQLPLETIQTSLASDDARIRANAIELLDNTLDNNLKASLIPYLDSSIDKIEDYAQKKLNIKALNFNERLQEILVKKDEWLKACALYYIGKKRYKIHDETLEKLAGPKNSPLVQELANYVQTTAY